AKNRNFLGLISEQSVYNLNERTIELEVIPACEAYGIGLIPYSPLAGGLLAGALKQPKVGRRADKELRREVEQSRTKLQAYETLCRNLGEKSAEVALSWLLHQKGVTSVIIGPRTFDQLSGAIHAREISLSKTNFKALDEIFPGPGGPAPEAYAW
ncbi:MAG: aldo/keto reductase, partial [Nitrospirales bacterium]|nr:aldo/keto reductase [Nitrospirales bacterium]